MTKIARAWNQYWFRPAPLFDLAVARIIIVGTQLAIVWIAGPYVEHAALPDAMYDPIPILHILVAPLGWMFRPSLEMTEVIRWAVFAAGVTSIIGLYTNFSLLVFAWGNIFLMAYKYSFGDFHHPEGLMMIGLVMLALSPAGRALSIDDLRRRIRRSSSERKFERYSLTGDMGIFARWPLLSIRWLFAFAYSSAAYYKFTVGGADWLNGYTLQWYILQDAFRWDSAVGLWLGQQHGLSLVLSWFSVIFEGTFFLVLIVPALAWIYIPAGIGLHTGIYIAMGAPFFQWIGLYAVFVSWSSATRRVSLRKDGEPRFKHLDIYFDGLCPLCIRSMTMVRYADLFDRLRFRDLEEAKSRELLKAYPDLSVDDLRREMHVIAPDGSVTRGFFAFRTIVRHLPTMWPILPVFYLPFANRLGPQVYRRVATGRLRIQGCEDGACSRHGY